MVGLGLSGSTTTFLRSDGAEASVGTPGGTGFDYGVGGGSSVDDAPSVPNANDHEFQDGDTIGGTTLGSPGTAPAIVNNRLVITGGTSATADVKAVVWTAPSTPYSVTIKMSRKSYPNANHIAGVLLRNASTADMRAIYIGRNPTLGMRENFVQVASYTSLTVRSATPIFQWWNNYWAYLRITDDGTDIVCAFSEDGTSDNWVDLHSEARGTFFTGGNFPDQFGVMVDSFNGTVAGVGFFHWLRVT